MNVREREKMTSARPYHPPRVRAARLAEGDPRPRRHRLALVPQCAQLGALRPPHPKRTHIRCGATGGGRILKLEQLQQLRTRWPLPGCKGAS